MKFFLLLILFMGLPALVVAQDVFVTSPHAPHYPAIALAEGVSENIEVKVTIKKNGKVFDAKAISGLNIFLKSESKKSAMKWQFNKSEEPKREAVVHFSYVALNPAQDINPDVEFPTPLQVTIRQHQRETSGPSYTGKVNNNDGNFQASAYSNAEETAARNDRILSAHSSPHNPPDTRSEESSALDQTLKTTSAQPSRPNPPWQDSPQPRSKPKP